MRIKTSVMHLPTSWLLRTAVFVFGSVISLGKARTGSPGAAILQHNRATGRSRVARLSAKPAPHQLNRPSGLEQVIRSAFDPISNALRIYASPNPPGQRFFPTRSNQIFTSVFNSAQNVIQVNCISGCSGIAASLACSSTRTIVAIPFTLFEHCDPTQASRIRNPQSRLEYRSS